MASLHRFKLLATQCGVAPSPTRSPRTSPLIHLRRRRTTLRAILLGRRTSAAETALRSSTKPIPKRLEEEDEDEEEKKQLLVTRRRNSLKELFVSSSASPPLEVQDRAQRRNVQEATPFRNSGRVVSRSESGFPRPGWSGFRNRSLLRRVWRPVLVAIPE